MTRAAVVWSDANELKCAGLSESADNIVSRSVGASIFLTDRRVSRSPHAAFRYDSGRFFVEQIKTDVMPTSVNDVVITGPSPLSDGDIVQVGSTRLMFHDLAAADRRSARVQCGYCAAENDDRRSECWRCGENLANARSAVYETARVECRIVERATKIADLYRDESFALPTPASGGRAKGSQPAEVSAEVVAREGGSYLRLPPEAAPFAVSGQPAEDGRQLKTGDTLGSGEDVLLVIVR